MHKPINNRTALYLGVALLALVAMLSWQQITYYRAVHEIEEAATDPLINAWSSLSNQNENADKCAWNFGAYLTSTSTPSYAYNYIWGATNSRYLIQQEFKPNTSPSFPVTGTATKGSKTITLATFPSGITTGMFVIGSGIPTGAMITATNSTSKTVTISVSTTAAFNTLPINLSFTYSTSTTDVWAGACSLT